MILDVISQQTVLFAEVSSYIQYIALQSENNGLNSK